MRAPIRVLIRSDLLCPPSAFLRPLRPAALLASSGSSASAPPFVGRARPDALEIEAAREGGRLSL